MFPMSMPTPVFQPFRSPASHSSGSSSSNNSRRRHSSSLYHDYLQASRIPTFAFYPLLRASLPLQVQLLCKFGVHTIGRQDSRRRVRRARQSDLTVDVQQSLRTTRTPDDTRILRLIVNEVVLTHGTGEIGLSRGLSRLTAEIIGRFLGPGDTFIQTDVAAVVGAEDGELKPARVMDADVQLAVFAVFGHRDSFADRGHVAVED